MSALGISLQLKTSAEYLAWEEHQTERHEYLNGVVLAISGGSYAHNQIIGDLAQEIGIRLLGTPCRKFTSSQRVRVVDANSYLYPDVGIHCGEPELTFGDSLLNPIALFEVLSPSTEKFDRQDKFHRYQTIETLQEYFLVHQDRAKVEVFRRTSSGAWEPNPSSTSMGLEASFTQESVGITIPLSGIYHGVLLLEEEALPNSPQT